MAVWASPTFKLDLAKALYENAPKLLVPALGRTVSPYLSPDPSLGQIDKDWTWPEVADQLRWNPDRDIDDEDGYLKTFESGVDRWLVGTPALYELIHVCRIGRFNASKGYAWSQVDDVLSQFASFVSPSTQITPKAFMKEWRTVIADLETEGRRYLDLSEGFKYARFSFKAGRVTRWDQTRAFGAGARAYYGVMVGELMVLRGSRERVNLGLVLTRSHLDILIEALARLGNTYLYVANEHASRPGVARGIVKMVDLTLDTVHRASRNRPYELVKAFQKARSYTQMRMFRNEQSGAMASELAAYSADTLEAILPMATYIDVAEAVPVAYRMDAMQVYKWMPPPDFDVTRAMSELRALHNNPRMSGADPAASDALKDAWRRIRLERKLNIAAAFRRLNGAWPPGLSCKAAGPTLAEVSAWKPGQLFQYRQFGEDISAIAKDSATVEGRLDDERAKPASAKSKRYLLWFMENHRKFDTRKLLKDFASGGFPEDLYVKVEYKGESHKPDSRPFFVAPPLTRVLMSEFEANLAKVAGAYPGSLQGVGSATKGVILSRVMDVATPPSGVDIGTESTVYVVTFDLTKFSPRSSRAVYEDYHKFWAEVYGVKELADLVRIGCDSEILHTKNGVKFSYKTAGPDLEGFRGRLNTMFHADMLGAAVRKAKEIGAIDGKGQLAVFIDDGAVKIAVKGSGATARHNVNRFLTCMQEIYAGGGQENHPSKTVVSQVGGDLLAEPYVRTKRLPCGIKAAMRLLPDTENPAVCLPEELDGFFATSQGAVKDGSDWIAAYKGYVTACVLTVHRWARRQAMALDATSFALKLMTPKSMGGFGIQPLQGLVTTAGSNLTTEGFAMLNRAARVHVGIRGTVNRIVRQSVVTQPPLAIMRNPLRVRANTPVMVENRLTMRVIHHVEEFGGPLATFMGGYRSSELRDHATGVAQAILASGVVSVPVLTRAWKATPLCFVETVVSKFKRSASVISLLGYRRVGAVRRANLSDVKLVLETYH